MPTFPHRSMTRERQAYIEVNGEEEPQVPPYERPRTYGDCEKLPRPCPFVGCRYHLFLEINRTGTIRTIEDDPSQLPQTCTLDVANTGPKSLEEIGEILGITRERVRQIEASALESLKHAVPSDMKSHAEALNSGSQTSYHVHHASSFVAAIRRAEDAAESYFAIDKKDEGADENERQRPDTIPSTCRGGLQRAG